MASSAYGELIFNDGEVVVYRFATKPGMWEGVLEIPVRDVQAWHIHGRQEPGGPMAASAVMMKAVRRYREAGTWPSRVAFQS